MHVGLVSLFLTLLYDCLLEFVDCGTGRLKGNHHNEGETINL